MKQIINIITPILLIVAAVTSCVDDSKLEFEINKPASITNMEYLNDYNALKTYVNRTDNPNFKLGAGVSVADYNAQGLVYRVITSNFDEMTAGYEMKHAAVVQNDGSLNLTNVSNFLKNAQNAGISVYGHTLCWHTNQNAKYLNSLIAPDIIPSELEPQWEEITAQDFETNAAPNYSFSARGEHSFTTAGEGFDGTGRALKIVNTEIRTNDHDVQLFITFPRTVAAGEKWRLTMNIKSDANASYPTQAQTAPGAFKHWDFFGSLNSTSEWKTYTKEITVSNDQASCNTIAFNLGKTATTFYFDDIKVEFYNLKPISTGTDIVADFESDTMGATYPMTNGGSATVATDPKGASGKVLNVKGAQTHPQFTVNLPGGRTLGEYKSVTLDFLGTGSTGLYGQGMRMSIDGGALSAFDSPSTFGCPDGDWGRGKIILQLSNLNLTADQKKLRNFTLAVGSATGSGDYYIDNVTMQWESSGDKIIEKTDEEKKQILTTALETWILGIMSASTSVKAWDIVNEPMSDWPDPSQLKTGIGKASLAADEFYWQDYLGKDYAVTAIQIARRQEGHGSDLLFINDYGLENNLDKCRGLIEYIEYVESKGVKVDGIGTQMHVSLNSCDREKIAEHFRLLAATGKLIKITELDMGITVDGTAIKTDSATDELLRAQADLYKYIVKSYFEIIPAGQRYGITQWAVTDSPTSSSWRAGEPIGLWSLNYNNRKHAYAGFADGLSGAK